MGLAISSTSPRSTLPWRRRAERARKPVSASDFPALARCSVVVAPGLNDSGPQHWQTHWQQLFPRFTRIRLDDWSRPDLDAWARAIVETALTQQKPVIVVAHSFGCLGAIKAARLQSGLIAGALLVAPAEPAKFGLDAQLDRIAPDFPSVLVMSEDDPWLAPERAWHWSLQWGSQLLSLGAAGHVNAQSGHRRWHEGLRALEQLCRRVVN